MRTLETLPISGVCQKLLLGLDTTTLTSTNFHLDIPAIYLGTQ